jgi:hypothetical protein
MITPMCHTVKYSQIDYIIVNLTIISTFFIKRTSHQGGDLARLPGFSGMPRCWRKFLPMGNKRLQYSQIDDTVINVFSPLSPHAFTPA